MSRPFTEFPVMPDISPLKKNTWILKTDYVGPCINGKRTTVEQGFKTDGASIPRIARLFVNGKMQIPLIAAAVLHDAEYNAELYDRNICDWRFLESMQSLKIIWPKRNAIYSAVRCFGWLVWDKHTELEVLMMRDIISSVVRVGTI